MSRGLKKELREGAGRVYTWIKIERMVLHMRRRDREMDGAFACQVLDKCAYMVLAMTDREGNPYCIPVSGVREGMTLYFHCALEGEKADCMHRHPRVCVTGVGETVLVPEEFTIAFESAVARGTAEEVTVEAEKIHALRLLCLRYAASNMAEFDGAVQRSLGRTGIWKITMDSVTGKRKK